MRSGLPNTYPPEGEACRTQCRAARQRGNGLQVYWLPKPAGIKPRENVVREIIKGIKTKQKILGHLYPVYALMGLPVEASIPLVFVYTPSNLYVADHTGQQWAFPVNTVTDVATLLTYMLKELAETLRAGTAFKGTGLRDAPSPPANATLFWGGAGRFRATDDRCLIITYIGENRNKALILRVNPSQGNRCLKLVKKMDETCQDSFASPVARVCASDIPANRVYSRTGTAGRLLPGILRRDAAGTASSTKHCRACGSPLPDTEAAFCPVCGSRQDGNSTRQSG